MQHDLLDENGRLRVLKKCKKQIKSNNKASNMCTQNENESRSKTRRTVTRTDHFVN
jgi:hypothetical protein